MPTYDYECQKCKHIFEVFQKMSDKPKGACPKCAGPAHRLIGTGSGVIFKGAGFYETDYKKKKEPKNKKPCGGSAKSDSCKDCQL